MEINKEAVARLERVDGEMATAFLISPEFVVTAKHIVKSREVNDYSINFPNVNPSEIYKIVEIDFDEDIDIDCLANDIAILKLNEPITYITPLNLSFSVTRGEKWLSFGFPGTQTIIGEVFEGTILDVLDKNLGSKHDLSLYCEKPQITDGRYGIKGASGAPILREGKVVAVFSNESAGSVIGAATLKRSRDLLKKYIEIEEVELEETPLQKAINEAVYNTARFIEGFSDEIQNHLQIELAELHHQLLSNLEEFQEFLMNSKYPIADEKTLINGLEATIEIVLLLKSLRGNIQFLNNDDFANISLGSTNVHNMIFSYASKRNQPMPEILLEMHNNMLKKSASQYLIKLNEPIPPVPVIFDNCSQSMKYNLCGNCGQTFRFEGILKSYLESEDDGLIKGIESNNFESLNKAKVVCGECIRKVQNQVETITEFIKKVGEKIYV